MSGVNGGVKEGVKEGCGERSGARLLGVAGRDGEGDEEAE